MKISDIDIFVTRPMYDHRDQLDNELEAINVELTAAEQDYLLDLLRTKRKEAAKVLKTENLRTGTRTRVKRERGIIDSLIEKLEID